MIDVSKISAADNRIIGMRFLPLVEDYFKDEKHEAAFQKWLKKRKKGATKNGK